MWPKSYPRVSESEILKRRSEPASKELIVHLWRRWIAEYWLMKVAQYTYGSREGAVCHEELSTSITITTRNVTMQDPAIPPALAAISASGNGVPC